MILGCARTSSAVAAALALAFLGSCAAPSTPHLSAPPAQLHLLFGKEIEARIEAQFIARDPDYRAHRAAFGGRLHDLTLSLAKIQATGNDMACSNQIYLEAKWLYRYTVEWDRLDHKLDQLNESLKNTDQAFALLQSPETHLWGVCYDKWFLQAEAIMTGLDELSEEGQPPSYLLPLPETINTPAKLTAYLDSLLVSDIAATGRDNRGELGSITTSLSSAVFKDYLREYLPHAIEFRSGKQGDELQSDLEKAYESFLRRWQDPKTGYWGAWYRINGRIYKTPDLSITYHTIAYSSGEVAHWPQIIDTTLRIRNDSYPFGWLHDGHFNNHNSYDVVRILKLGWPHMSVSQKQQAAAAIREMLDWALTRSLEPDGSFVLDPAFFSSVAADFYFGVSFLDKAGYWDRAKRFWTDESFPEGLQVCRRIRTRLLALGLQAPPALDALQRLNGYCGE